MYIVSFLSIRNQGGSVSPEVFPLWGSGWGVWGETLSMTVRGRSHGSFYYGMLSRRQSSRVS